MESLRADKAVLAEKPTSHELQEAWTPALCMLRRGWFYKLGVLFAGVFVSMNQET